MGTRRRSTSSAVGPWIALSGLLVVAASVGVGVWFMKARPADPASPPEVASQKLLSSVITEPTPAVANVDSARRAMEEAPVLTEESAAALLTEMARRGLGNERMLDSALFVASTGLADLDRATLGELGERVAKSWGARSASEQRLIQAYMRHAREGEPLSPEVIAAGRTLFAEGVRALPAASQERLRALFAKAIQAGIAHQLRAEESAQVASLTPLPSAETPSAEAPSAEPAEQAERPRSSARATADADDRRSESPESAAPGASDWDRLNAKNQHWRQRYQSAKATVDRLEAEVAKLEEDAKNNFVAGYRTIRVGDRIVTLQPDPNSPYKSYAERIEQRLPAARRELAAAKQALTQVEDAARRDGVGSGQLY